MKFKAVILDLDGTTVPSSRTGMPSKKVVAAVHAAQAKSVKVCVATGRSPEFCGAVFKVLKIVDPCVVNGGAEIINPQNGKLLFNKYISVKHQKETIKICLRFGYKVFSGLDDYQSPIKSANQITDASPKLWIGGVKKADSLSLLEELSVVSGVSPHATTSWLGPNVVDIHICDSRATKKHAVAELLKIMKVKKSESIGIGDYHNDLPLLESVGYKVVMGNAPKELKAIADLVTGTLAEDGVAMAIKKLVVAN